MENNKDQIHKSTKLLKKQLKKLSAPRFDRSRWEHETRLIVDRLIAYKKENGLSVIHEETLKKELFI